MSHIDRRRQILDASLKAFSTAGYHATSMNGIAESLNITKPVVYQYFDSKRALYLELLKDVGESLLSSVTTSISASGDPREQVEQGMIAYFTWVDNNRDAFALLFESSARVDDEFEDIISEFEDGAARAIAPFIAVAKADVYTFAIGIVGMAEAVSRQVIKSGRAFQPETLGHDLAVMAWGGLRSIGQH